MDPQLAAHRLTEIALLLEVRGENPFKSRAFSNAARAVAELDDDDIAPKVRSKEIAKLPGIGATTFAVLSDLVETGDSEYLEALKESTPKGLIEMMRIPGLGPTRIRRIYEGLKVETVGELEEAARDGRLAGLSGFGLKTADKILKGIATYRESSGQVKHASAAAEAQRLQRSVAKLPDVRRVEVAGSFRRSSEVIRDIDIVAGCADGGGALTAARKIPGVTEVLSSGDGSVTLRLISGMRTDIHCVPDEAFSVAFWRATGSAGHCEAVIERLRQNGFSIRDDQLIDRKKNVVTVVDERTIYEAAGLAWIPPELRENRGEVEAAATGTLPELIEMRDLTGVLHCHSHYSDGSTSIAEMVKAAQERGWKYLGISDHSQFAAYAGGMTADKVKRQHDEIDELNQKLKGFRVLKGVEADILADGTVDFADSLLDRFEFVIGSIHSRFGMDQAAMTERVLRAMTDPRLTMLGHPTGRLLLRRDPVAVDMDAIMEMAAETGLAMELNCDPNRLDLDWRWLQQARKRGITIEIGPDAHSPRELGFVDFGMQIARKGWLERVNVLNTGSADEILDFAKRRRESGATRKAGKRGA